MADDTEQRRQWMGVLARAPAAELAALWAATRRAPAFGWLRPPEAGAVMLRGRTGGTGAPFNIGEMSVIRCALRLEDGGAVGHAWVAGHDPDKARVAALCDALLQTPEAARIRADVLAPLAAAAKRRAAERAGRAASTRVEFFTLVRGEDA